VRAVVFVLAFGLLAAQAGASSGLTNERATIRLVDMAPVTFRGSEFAARESVRVTVVRQTKRFSKTVRANAQGAFRVTFGLIAIDVCRGTIQVTATGDRGSRATFKRACRPPLPKT
jgi:hypothetical protein